MSDEKQAELAKLNRDLRFTPVNPVKARTLTAEQVAFYNTNGYLKPFRIFDQSQTRANRAYFDFLTAEIEAADDGRDAYSINGYQNTCRGLWDLTMTDGILDLVADIIGPDIVSWGGDFFCKLAGDPKRVSWHQDAVYWPLTPARTVSAWLAIDDTDRENGCMQVIPGSHCRGPLALRESDAAEQNVLAATVIDVEQYGDPVCFELQAGEISLHSDMLLHSSEPNRSNRRRCGLTIRYANTAVTADWNFADAAILCRGEDPDNNWAHVPQPPGEDTSLRPWQK